MDGMSDEENDLITSDYFSETTPQSDRSVFWDHRYALSPITTTSLTPKQSPKSRKNIIKIYKRRKLFAKDCESNKPIEGKVTPLSERQQLALALQLSANQSNGETQIGLNQTNNASIGVSKKIRRNHKGETDLHIAAIKGDLNRVKLIISQSKLNIDITDFAGWAPIHEACNRGFISIVEELLKAGANVNAKGYNNDTPLIDASVNGHYDLVQLLLTYGADYNLTNNSGKTALQVAKSDKVISVIKSFIEEKMRKNGGNKDKDIVGTCVSKSRASSPSNCSSPSKPTSPRLTLRFQTIRDKSSVNTSAISQTQSPSSSTMTSTKSYSVSTTIDKDKDNTPVEPSFTDKQNDNNNKVITSNGSSMDAVSASSDHNYTSIDSSLMAASDEGSRGRKRRKSNDGSVSSTSASSGGPSSSRSSSTSSVASSTQQSSSHNKKHHHHHHHHASHHHSSKTNTNNSNSKDKTVKKLYSSSSDSEGVEGSETGDKDTNNKDVSNQAFNSSATNAGNAATEMNSPKVPPIRIVLPANISNTSSSTACATTASNGGTQSSISSMVTSTSSSSAAKFPYVVSSSDETFQCESDSVSGSTGSQRITRSSQRVAQQQSQKTSGGGIEHQSDSEESVHTSEHPRKRKIRNNNANDSKNNSFGVSSANNSVNNTSNHNSKDGDNDNDSSSSSSSVNGVVTKDVSPFALPSTNCYQMFLSIRKHIDKKRKEMFLVHPKAPEGFKDYLINRCSYALEGRVENGNNGSENVSKKPTLSMPPTSLSPDSGMCKLFCEQEKQRYKLKIQHLIEREKLILSAEQEILRVYGRAARAMANQNVPFSATTILKDEEIYNILETETDQNESISNQIKLDKPLVSGLSGRTRYNGRLFLSWRQDVDDKWEKIKESMLLRHRKESESLLAMQRLEWEWKLKELGLCDVKTNPTIDEKHVPPVQVSDDFDLFPA